MVNFMQQGFGLVRLQPYCGWDECYEQFVKMFQLYKKYMTPKIVTRLATRFVNRFHFDHDIDLAEYFNTMVQSPSRAQHQIPSAVPNQMHQMSYRMLQSHHQALSHTVFDVQTDSNTNNMHIVLDVDVFLENLAIPLDGDRGGAQMGEVFKKIRGLKNELFEATVTDKLRSTFR